MSGAIRNITETVSIQLRVHRIGPNSFLLFYVRIDGGEMYDKVLDAGLCSHASGLTLDELQSLLIEPPKNVEPQIHLSMRGLLIFTLMSENSDVPQILPDAKTKLAHRLVMRGLKEKGLTELMGGAKAEGKSLVDRVTHYLNNLHIDGEKVNKFVGLAYLRGWLDDTTVQDWWNKEVST